MKTFLKALALLAAITSVVWIAVIWHWQSTHRDMSAEDLAIDLVILPLVVFALVVGMRWAWRGAVARQAASLALAPGAATAAATHAQGPAVEDRDRALAWPLLGAWVAGPAGNDVAGLLDAAKSGKPGPAPDSTLRDDQGLPIMCARASAIDTAAIEQAWTDWNRGQKDGAQRAAPRAHAIRALAALAQTLAPSGEKVMEWWQSVPDDRRERARVRVLVAWPEGWTDDDRAWAFAWLNAQLAGLGGEELGAERWLAQHLPAVSGPQAWQQADRLLLALERECCDDLVLLLACHSNVSEPAVEAMERSGRLFCADRRPSGEMPGEGAAALLLMRAGRSRDAGQMDAMAWLHRPACVRRDKSIHAPGRTSAEVARQAVSEAVAAAAINASDLAGLCSDAERHSPRATELFGTSIELMPSLDPVEDMRLLGVVQGHAAHTGACWAVAGAALQARESERPTLALSLADPHWRMALVVRHAPAAPSAPPPDA
ncbi:hypothetical protein [Ideonella sp. YS5]|uniref:hypothetical protein n=1 Tax=Ideonella sp. YS5 TaxID=3453714 RepID=UPI003EEE94C5